MSSILSTLATYIFYALSLHAIFASSIKQIKYSVSKTSKRFHTQTHFCTDNFDYDNLASVVQLQPCLSTSIYTKWPVYIYATHQHRRRRADHVYFKLYFN